MIIFKEIFENIFTTFSQFKKNAKLLLMTIFPIRTSPWHVLYMDKQENPTGASG